MKIWIALPALFVLVQDCFATEPTLRRFEYSEPHMGTRFRIVVYCAEEAQAKAASKAGFDRIAELNRIMSDYDPESELMRLCRRFEKKVDDPVKVSNELLTVLVAAKRLSASSGGVFDVSIGPMVKLWRQSRRTQKLPSVEELTEARARVGYAWIEIDEKAQTVRLKKPGMQLDLGGIAKGYAADEVLSLLKRKGIDRALVAAGGDVAVSGPPPGSPGWTVTIAPLLSGKPTRTLQLAEAAVSTSGDAQQFTLINGVRYSHIVDPRTGLGLTGRRSVTVVARHGITADSHTKAVMMMNMDVAMKLVEETADAAALIITEKDGQEIVQESRRFARYLATP